MKRLKKNLQNICREDEIFIEELLSLFKQVNFRKGTIISSPAHSFSALHFIESGLVEIYYETTEKIEVIQVLQEGFLLPAKGFQQNLSTHQYCRTLEDTFAWVLNLTEAEPLAHQKPIFYKFLLEICELALKESIEREMLIRMPKAEDRFYLYKQHHQDLLFSVKNELIASVLRMSVKQLGRMKALDAKRIK